MMPCAATIASVITEIRCRHDTYLFDDKMEKRKKVNLVVGIPPRTPPLHYFNLELSQECRGKKNNKKKRERGPKAKRPDPPPSPVGLVLVGEPSERVAKFGVPGA